MKSENEMIALNTKQALYYDSIQEAEDLKGGGTGYAATKRANLVTKVWAKLRYKQQEAVRLARITERQIEAHRRWILPKRGGLIMELGCFSGSQYTSTLIELAGQYYGVELSGRAVNALNDKIAAQGVGAKARAIQGDLLAIEGLPLFDVLHAHAVLHHFENPKPLFEKLSRMIKPDGILVFSEPCAVNAIYKCARALYRPFQSDAAWEWPFTEATVGCLLEHFEPYEGFGWGRSSLPLSILTGAPIIGRALTSLYVRQVEREVAEGLSARVWKNSYVTAVCRPRSGLRS